MPGFIDAHAHFAIGPVKVKMEDKKPVVYLDLDESFAKKTANLLLAHGITTTRDPGGKTEVTVGTKRKVANGNIAGPEMFVAGNILDTLRFENLTTTVKTKEDIVQAIRNQKDEGVDFIKLYTSLSPELLKAGIDETKRLGLKSVSHLHTTSWTEAAELGLDHIVHIIPGSPDLLPEKHRNAYEKYAKLGAIAFYKWFEYVDLNSDEITAMITTLQKNNVSVDPTLVPFHAAFFGNKNIYQVNEMLRYMPDDMIENWRTSFNFNLGWKPNDFEIAQQNWPKVEQLVRMLHENGIMLTAGTDANNPWIVPGDSFHSELELLAQCGLSNATVLRIATLNGAKLVGADHRIGLVEEGYEADLVLLNANPIDDISNTRRIDVVLKDGEKIDTKGLLKSLE